MTTLRLALLLMLILLLLAAPARAAPAAVITVNTLADLDTDDAFCTLREAIIASNTQAAYHGCAAGGDLTAINISVTGTIGLSDPLPAFTSDVIITGPGSGMSDLVISGAGKYQVFNITSPLNVTVQNLTLEKGYGAESAPGAGIIANGGVLTIKGAAFRESRGDSRDGGAAVRGDGTTIHISGHSYGPIRRMRSSPPPPTISSWCAPTAAWASTPTARPRTHSRSAAAG